MPHGVRSSLPLSTVAIGGGRARKLASQAPRQGQDSLLWERATPTVGEGPQVHDHAHYGRSHSLRAALTLGGFAVSEPRPLWGGVAVSEPPKAPPTLGRSHSLSPARSPPSLRGAVQVLVLRLWESLQQGAL